MPCPRSLAAVWLALTPWSARVTVDAVPAGWDAYCSTFGPLHQDVVPLTEEEQAKVAGLRQVQVAVRHGNRNLYAPMQCFRDFAMSLNCSLEATEAFAPLRGPSIPLSFVKAPAAQQGCPAGQLLPSAVPRIRETGRLLRDTYLGAGKALGPISVSDPGAVHVRTTVIERTQATAFFLVDTLKQSNDSVVELHTHEATSPDPWRPAPCPAAEAVIAQRKRRMHAELAADPAYGDFRAKWRSALGFEFVPDWTSEVFNFDCLLVGLCEKQALPPALTQELSDQGLAYSLRSFSGVYGHSHASRLLASRMLREMKELAGTGVRFGIWATHDNALIALLSGLDVWDGVYTAYVDMTTVEIYDLKAGGRAVRLLRRGKPLRLPGCEALCPEEQFFGTFADLGPNACQVQGAAALASELFHWQPSPPSLVAAFGATAAGSAALGWWAARRWGAGGRAGGAATAEGGYSALA